MTLEIRRLIQIALGVLGGLASWPLLELLSHLESRFSGYLAYTAISGAVFGLLFGAFLGGAEGIIASRGRRILTGTISGALIGGAGGAVGFLVGQGVLFLIGERLATTVAEINRIALPIGRAVGWAILGACVGASGGIRVLSARKSLIGALGGFSGGIVGGAIVEYGRLVFAGVPAARLLGLLALGALIGLAYAWVEKRLSFGVFRVLNGPFKSREFILNQRRMVIGARAGCDIPVPAFETAGSGGLRRGRGYREVAGRHCRLFTRGHNLFVQPLEGRVRLNEKTIGDDDPAAASPLKYDDVVACGEARFLYLRG